MNLSLDTLTELMFDLNYEFLIDIHDELKEDCYYLGLFQFSQSPQFIQTILDNVIFDEMVDDDEFITD
jgi:hypothetical protein